MKHIIDFKFIVIQRIVLTSGNIWKNQLILWLRKDRIKMIVIKCSLGNAFDLVFDCKKKIKDKK